MYTGDLNMQQAYQNRQRVIAEGDFKSALDRIQNFALRLSPQQARTLACDVIQCVNRVEAIKNLKQAPPSITKKVRNEVL